MIQIARFARKFLPVPVKRVLGQLYLWLIALRGLKEVKSSDGRKFKFIKDRLFLGVVVDGSYEPELSGISAALIEAGDQVVDIGANFGWYTTLFACQVGNSGKVHSYEPSARSFAILKDNIELNELESRIKINNVCVGSTEGKLHLQSGSDDDSGRGHVVSAPEKNTVEVTTEVLDSQLNELKGNISFVKIDIEGFEMEALKGMEGILSSTNPPIIQIELNEAALVRNGDTRKGVVNFLTELGYSMYCSSSVQPVKVQLVQGDDDSDVFCAAAGEFGDRLRKLNS